MVRKGDANFVMNGYLYAAFGNQCSGTIPGIMRFSEFEKCELTWIMEDNRQEVWNRPNCNSTDGT